jgi:transposase
MSDPMIARRGRRPDPALHEQWRQRFARFDSSGLTVAAFCAQEGVAVHVFYSWKRRLNGPATQRPSVEQLGTASSAAPFVPVRLRAAAPVELQLSNGATLRLTPGCDLDFVRSLVTALGEP